MSHKRVRFDLDPPVEEMRAMSLQHHLVTPTRNTRKAQPPTWGQLKKLTQEAEKLLNSTGRTFSAGNMFLAMLAVIATTVGANSSENLTHHYWAYVPNPPLNKIVEWTDAPVPIYVNESRWLPGPYDMRGPLIPGEEGTKIENYLVGTEGPPICMGHGDHCLKVEPRAWLSMVRNNSLDHGHPSLFLFQAWAFKGATFITSSPPKLPPCHQRVTSKISDWVHWEACRSNTGRVLLNTSYGSIIDWSPYGSARAEFSNRDLKWKRWNNTISTQANEPIVWHGGGMSEPQPKIEYGPPHPSLWKLVSALHPLRAWKGSYTKNKKDTQLSFTINSTHYTQACVHLPYVIMIGEAKWNASEFLLTCTKCRFYTCLNNSIPFNHFKDSIYILKQRAGIWIPVNLERPWQQTPASYMLQNFLDKLIKRSKRFLGVLIAVILGIISITATAAVAGVALHQTVQTTQFVQTWHEHSDRLWKTQSSIDEKLATQIADLEQAVVLLGDQIISLQTQLRLKCDWNSSSFCVTPHRYNNTLFPWQNVRKHLMNQGNLSFEIGNLQKEIFETFNNKLELLQGTDLLEAMGQGIEHLNPLKQFHFFETSTVVLYGIIIVLCLSLILVWRRSFRRRHETERRIAALSLILQRLVNKQERKSGP